MGPIEKLRLLWRARKAQEVIVAEVKAGWNWQIAVKKAVISASKGALVALTTALCSLSDSDVRAWLEQSGFPPAVVPVLLLLLMAGIRFGGNWLKHAALLALLLLPGLASAQDMPVNAMATEQTEQAPAPLSASQAAEQTEGITVDVQTWTLALITRDERREYAGGRVTLDAPAGPVRLFARADIAGTQSDAFDFGDYSSFRSIELFVGARYPFRSGAALAVAGGVTYSIEGKDGPADPRIYSALALVRLPLPGGGYAYAGGGHRGPVGGLAAVASVSYPVGPTRAIVDYDFPLQVDAQGAPKPWVLRTGIAVPLKRWTLR